MALMYCRECGKQVSSEAPSCPGCGVPSPVYVGGYPTHPAAAVHQPPVVYQPPIIVSQKDTGIAAVLSVFWPGLGQIYKGEVGAGIAWFLATIVGYVMLIVPGLILHICCIVDAARRKY